MKYVRLNNGVEMPILGFGVYQIVAEDTEEAVLDALSTGYRLIDTAQIYGNEEEVGNAIRKSGIPREEIFLTTKVWIYNAGYEKAKKSIEQSLEKLQTDYLDLILVHQPYGDYYGTYRAMEEAHKKGKTRAIGVSNFYPDRLVDMCLFSEISPALNQIETHPFFQRGKDNKVMENYRVQHQSWGSFAEGREGMFTNPILAKIGKKHNKSIAQVILRYFIELKIVVIPKTVHKDRMKENIDVFDFELSKEDRKIIKAMDKNETAFFSHQEAETVELITGFKHNNLTN